MLSQHFMTGSRKTLVISYNLQVNGFLQSLSTVFPLTKKLGWVRRREKDHSRVGWHNRWCDKLFKTPWLLLLKRPSMASNWLQSTEILNTEGMLCNRMSPYSFLYQTHAWQHIPLVILCLCFGLFCALWHAARWYLAQRTIKAPDSKKYVINSHIRNMY